MISRWTRPLIATVTIFLGLGVMFSAVKAQTTDLEPIEDLGRSIFFDENLSILENQSCASCHGPAAGWTGPISEVNSTGAVYEGSIEDRFGGRKPPSAAYATPSPIFHLNKKDEFIGGNFWDGRATGEKLGNPAADQSQGPFLNSVEQGLRDSACVIYLILNSEYADSFYNVWGDAAADIEWPDNMEELCSTEGDEVPLLETDRLLVEEAYDQMGLSIAAYEASPEVKAFSSKYDYYLDGVVKLTKTERKGLALFRGKAKCAKCHSVQGKQPLFTDFTFDNLGVPANPQNPHYPEFVDPGLGGFLADTAYADMAEENKGKHKVPTLRNVDKRPYDGFVKAYMHNGVFTSLKEVVHFYNTRDVEGIVPEVADNVNTAELGDLGLNEADEDAIVEFLKTLSDGYVPD